MANMRAKLTGIAALGVVLVILLAQVAGTGGAPRGQTDRIVVAQSAEPRTLDPQRTTSSNDFRIMENIYDGLVRFRSGTLEIEPALAESWTISDDGRRYTFQLRRGVTFHDGTLFDAKDVLFTFRRMLDPEHPQHEMGPFPLAYFFQKVESVEATDSHTVVFTLSEPFAPFLANLAYPTGYIIPAEAVRANPTTYSRNPVGTGPFQFADWQSNRFVKLVRNETHWETPAPVETVFFRTITDENTRLTELLAGGVDIVMEVPADMVTVFHQRGDFRVHETPKPHVWFLILNLREGPFTDLRVRKAANYAIDKERITGTLLQDTATVAHGPIPRAFGWVFAGTDAASEQTYPYNPEKARALLEAAGAVGAELTFYITDSAPSMLEPKGMATAIQANLEAVGFAVTIETYEWNTYLDKVNDGLEGDADLAQMAWTVNDPDTLPYLTLRSAATPEGGGFNSGYYANLEVDRLIEAARRETNRTERASLYRQIDRQVRDDAPWVFVASALELAVVADGVRGFTVEPASLFRLDNVSKQ